MEQNGMNDRDYNDILNVLYAVHYIIKHNYRERG